MLSKLFVLNTGFMKFCPRLLCFVFLSFNPFDPSGDAHHSLMPFRLDELIHMSLSLRNACLGMIECAHPETRPTVTKDYTRAMASVGVSAHGRSSDVASTWMHVFKVNSLGYLKTCLLDLFYIYSLNG